MLLQQPHPAVALMRPDPRDIALAVMRLHLAKTRHENTVLRQYIESLAPVADADPIDVEFEVVLQYGAGDGLTPSQASDLALDLMESLGATVPA